MNASGGTIPENAWNGHTENSPLYIARAERSDGRLFPGKLMPDLGVAHIPVSINYVDEYEKSEYQVLVKNPNGNCILKWVTFSGGLQLNSLIEGGIDGASSKLYICRAAEADIK